MAFDQVKRRLIFARAGACCEHCGAAWSDGIMLECDHVVPLNEGGSDDISNGQLLCRECHAKKHDRLARIHFSKRDFKLANEHKRAAAAIRQRGKKRWGY